MSLGLEPAAQERFDRISNRQLSDLGLGGPDDFQTVILISAAISLKRIADSLGEGSPFLSGLAATLDDASHNHQQRMGNL